MQLILFSKNVIRCYFERLCGVIGDDFLRISHYANLRLDLKPACGSTGYVFPKWKSENHFLAATFSVVE
ncbi:hypothetical protein J2S36_001025 [Arcanobacterium hippocoleae]|uniref:Uncharacterized protein n=1 Tax=Arcanobacterium hippocoleae TaxID=149017 RepID=A0ABU1T280_9ACTO|nr:hypothetical protein [Arcanobacterium hippocoleae]